jgi:VanZ family protein
MASGGFEKKWRVGLWAYAPVLLWIGVILFLSSPEGSFTQTSRIIGPLLHFFYPSITPETEAVIHGYIRKAAHFSEYAVLAFLACRACSLSASLVLQKWRYVLPLLLVALIASLDEFNQSFEVSRTSSIWDVALDFSGGIAMVIFLWAIKRPRIPDAQARTQ